MDFACVLHIIMMAGTTWKYLVEKSLDVTAEMAMEAREGSLYIKLCESTKFSKYVYSLIVTNTVFTGVELHLDPESTSTVAQASTTTTAPSP